MTTKYVAAMAPRFTLRDGRTYVRAVAGKSHGCRDQLERELGRGGLAPNATIVPRGRMGLRAIIDECALEGRRQILMPAYTDASVASTIVAAGYEPVYCDIDLRDCNPDPSRGEPLIGNDTALVIIGHMFGHPAAIDPWADLLSQKGIPWVEDVAHALGGRFNGAPLGSFGSAAFTSFVPFKVLQAHGGGAV